MNLLNFEKAEAIDEILKEIGMTSGVGEFFAQHLAELLSKQHPDVIIESVEFVGSDKCSLEGMEAKNGEIIEVESLCIPFDARAVLLSNTNIHQLDLHVQISAVATNRTWEVTTHIDLRKESVIGP